MPIPVPLIIVLVIIGIISVYVVIVYNSFVMSKRKIEEYGKRIDVELTNRFDLIPDLIHILKGLPRCNEILLGEIRETRNAYLTSNKRHQRMEIDVTLANKLDMLFVELDEITELKGNEKYLELHKQLEDSENKINYARKLYNEISSKYNKKISSFPSNIVARMFKYSKIEFFETSEVLEENSKS